MKKIIIALVLIGIFVAALLFWQYDPISSMHDQTSANSASSAKKPLYWVAPMDPNYRRDKPGKSPMGMDLVPVYAEQATDTGVKISPTIEQNIGVRVTTVKRQTLYRKINTVGYVTADENRIEHIHTYTDGWVKKLLVKATGESVQKGQVLFELYSPTLVNAQEEYLLALKSANKSLIEASYQKLLALGVSKNQITQLRQSKKTMQLIKIYATQSGIVAKLTIREGMYVTPSKELISLHDLSEIWVIGEVFERQSEWVKKGQSAEATLPYLPGKKWLGKVDYVYPRLDPTTHTLKVRLQFNNPDEVLKPNMYADVTILAAPERDVLAIPRQAVIYTGEGARVIISLGEGRFKAQAVELGMESGDLILVRSGLKEGDQIVTSAQFLIDSESNLNESFERLQSDNNRSSDQSQHHHHP